MISKLNCGMAKYDEPCVNKMIWILDKAVYSEGFMLYTGQLRNMRMQLPLHKKGK